MAARSEAEINSLLVYKSSARQGGVLYFMDGMDGFAGLALCRRLRKSEALVRGGAVGDQVKLLSSGTPISGGLEWTALHDRSTEDAASVKCIVEF